MSMLLKQAVRKRAWLLGALLIGLMQPGLLYAQGNQTGTITGTVTDDRTGDVLPGVNVVIDELQIGAATNSDGVYIIEEVPSGDYTLTARFVGYQSLSRDVQVSPGETVTVDIALREDVMGLDELVVTGVAGGEQRRSLGHDIGEVEASQVIETAPVSDVQSLLSGRVSGVSINESTGNVGGGGVTRVRGISSLITNEPLVYVDGIRVNSSPRSGPGQVGGITIREGQTVSRINDFNPEDLQTAEVIKGPSAATLYGTEASAGVMNLITKTGQAGPTRVNFVVTGGGNFLHDKSRLPNGYRLDSNGDLLEWNAVEQAEHQGATLFETGPIQSYTVSASGGDESTQFYTSVRWDDRTGYVPVNYEERLSGRLNISATLRDDLNARVGIGYSDSDTRLAQAISPGSRWDGVVWGHSGRTGSNGWYVADLPKLDDVSATTEAQRFTPTLALDHRPTEWFTHTLTVGADLTMTENGLLFPRGSAAEFGARSRGLRARSDVKERFTTFDYAATGNFNLTEEIGLSTSFGVQHYGERMEFTAVSGREFPAAGAETVDAAATNNGSEGVIESKSMGTYLQGRVNWRNRAFFTAAIRGDDNSAFGTDFEAAIYPKFSAAWVIAEESFFNVPGVSNLRLRAAWGQSGQQPDVFAADRLYAPATGPGDQPVLTPDNIGNPELGPEVGTELDIGFDASLFQDRIGLSLSYYQQTTRDAIIGRQPPLSAGFPGEQVVNLGEISNNGFEFEINGDVLSGQSYNWNLALNTAYNENEVTDLGGVEGLTGTYDAVREGYPIWGYWGVNIVDAELDENNSVIDESIMCEQRDGSVALCTESAPRLFHGPRTPKWQGGLSSAFDYRNVSVFTNIAFKLGHYRGDGDYGWSHILMFNTNGTVGYPAGEGVDDTIAGVSDGSINVTRYSQVDAPHPIVSAYASNTSWGRDLFILKAGFVRLRSLGARYTFPESITSSVRASRLSLSLEARNLWFLWRADGGEKYGQSIVDPETRTNDEFVGQTQTHLPPSSSITATLRFGF